MATDVVSILVHCSRCNNDLVGYSRVGVLLDEIDETLDNMKTELRHHLKHNCFIPPEKGE